MCSNRYVCAHIVRHLLLIHLGVAQQHTPVHQAATPQSTKPQPPDDAVSGCGLCRCGAAGGRCDGWHGCFFGCFAADFSLDLGTHRTQTTNRTERTDRAVEPLLRAGFADVRCPVGLVCPVSPFLLFSPPETFRLHLAAASNCSRRCDFAPRRNLQTRLEDKANTS